jgi:hypothetical protein
MLDGRGCRHDWNAAVEAAMLRDPGASAGVVLVEQLRTRKGAHDRGDCFGFGHADSFDFEITCERSVPCLRFIAEQTCKIVVVIWRRNRRRCLVEHLFGGVHYVAVRVELAEFDRASSGDRGFTHRFAIVERVANIQVLAPHSGRRRSARAGCAVRTRMLGALS